MTFSVKNNKCTLAPVSLFLALNVFTDCYFGSRQSIFLYLNLHNILIRLNFFILIGLIRKFWYFRCKWNKAPLNWDTLKIAHLFPIFTWKWTLPRCILNRQINFEPELYDDMAQFYQKIRKKNSILELPQFKGTPLSTCSISPTYFHNGAR